jgi:deoxyribose-phosphate aldolase
MRASCSPRVQIKAAGGVRDLDGLIKVRELGATRCGASATAAILDEYRKRESRAAATPLSHSAGAIGRDGC